MTPGSRFRRTATGFAALTIAALAGCHTVPVARIAPLPNRPESTLASVGRAALLPATVAMDPPSEMASIEPVPSGSSAEPSPGRLELPKAEPPPFVPAPTPMLDAALERARGVEAIVAAELARTPSQPSPAPSPAPADSKPSSPAIELPKAEPTVADPADPPKKEEPAEPPRPEDLWRDGVRGLVSLAKARVEQPGGSGTPWGLRARVLSWLAEPDIDPDHRQDEVDDLRAVLRVLDDAPTEGHRRGDEVREAVQVIEDRAPLEIVDLRLCSKVERFGDFEPFDPPVRKAGQAIIIYSEVDGVQHEATTGGFRTRLAAQVEIAAEGGGPPILTRSLGTAEEVCRRRRRDYYVAYRLVLPRTLAPGEYRLRLTEKDLTSDQSTTRDLAFAIARD